MAFPGSQSVHAVDLRFWAWVPTAHFTHAVLPAASAYFPVPHSRHAPDELAPAPAPYAPASHATQSAEVVELPTVPYVPATH